MPGIRAFSNRVSKLKEHNERILLLAIKDTKEEMLDLNRDQLLAGKTAENKRVGKYRSASYAKYKKTLNPNGVVDLKLTGRFHGSFFIKADKFPLIFGARDSKTNDLVEKYGETIFGLTKASLQTVSQSIKNNYLARVRKFLQL